MTDQEDNAMSRNRKLLVSLVVLSVTAAIAGTGVWAAFSTTTSNTGNQITTGSVSLSDNDAGAVLYDVTDASPGTSVQRCIQVSYTGSLSTDVRLYTPSTIGPLGQYVDFEVTGGTQSSPTFPDCTGFTPDGAPLFSGTLAGFASSHGSWANGLADGPGGATNWTNGDTVVYRVVATVQDDPAAAGLSTGTHSLVWEARA